MASSILSKTAYYFPENKISTDKLERILQDNSDYIIPQGLIQTILGVQYRYRADKNTYSSMMSINAIKKLNSDLEDVDVLIYASTTQDCIEPATSAIIVGSLGLSCLCFDIQNACNSMVNALEIADKFIVSGQYKKILIVGAETASKVIKTNHHNKESFRQSFSSFGMGDASVALIMEYREESHKGFLYSQSITDGSLRSETTILGGGSRYYDTLEHNFFIGNPQSLKDFFLTQGKPLIDEGCNIVGLSYDQFAHVFVHQVSHDSYYTVLDALALHETQLITTYEQYGNVGSCTIPLQIAMTSLIKDAYYLVIGLGAGASISCHIYQH